MPLYSFQFNISFPTKTQDKLNFSYHTQVNTTRWQGVVQFGR